MRLSNILAFGFAALTLAAPPNAARKEQEATSITTSRVDGADPLAFAPHAAIADDGQVGEITDTDSLCNLCMSVIHVGCGKEPTPECKARICHKAICKSCKCHVSPQETEDINAGPESRAAISEDAKKSDHLGREAEVEIMEKRQRGGYKCSKCLIAMDWCFDVKHNDLERKACYAEFCQIWYCHGCHFQQCRGVS